MPVEGGRAVKGSQRWLQALVNDSPGILNRAISECSSRPIEDIRWLSPLQQDNYREYYDQPFIDVLQVELIGQPLASFWPESGPRWDALGKSQNGQLLLVEAKSHVKELVSSLCAKDPRSVRKIGSALEATKSYLHRVSSPAVDWTTGVYQYANRLAHLYLLSVLNGLDAYLILVYFLNDHEMISGDTSVPASRSEWESVIAYQERLMGIRQRHPLSDRIIHVFIDVRDIEANR